MEIIAVHVFISGKVQGVNYRFYTVHKAKQLGINGWVRNLPNRSVEAFFEGEQSAVEQVLQWCQTGPDLAIVDSVEVKQAKPKGIRGFEVKY